MPIKTDFPLLPYLDPEFNPDHPMNNPPKIKEDPWLPYGIRQRRQLEREALEKALAEYQPPHVIRSWETDTYRAEQRKKILALVLHPKAVSEFAGLIPASPQDSSISRRESLALYDPANDEDHNDFRQFATKSLHLGYNRFHASNGEPYYPSEEADPTIPPEDICWIMEYTENECNTIRRRIAHAIGAFPAVTDTSNPIYDEEIAWRYERRLYCRCRRRNKKCIRPSHIEIFTSQFKLLP